MPEQLLLHAAEIEDECGPDIDEALARWEAAGAHLDHRSSGPWLSVAFLFGRRLKNLWREA